MDSIVKEFRTETAHIVRNATSERCRFNVHGHSYRFEVEIEGQINDKKNGMILDFIELKPIKEMIDQFDHAMVLWNKDEPEFKNFFITNCKRVLIMNKNCTAENMARLVFKKSMEIIQGLWVEGLKVKKVKVWETIGACGVARSCDPMDDFTLIQL